MLNVNSTDAEESGSPIDDKVPKENMTMGENPSGRFPPRASDDDCEESGTPTGYRRSDPTKRSEH
ncbi:hypothetical protein E4U13_004709 [Claviceps humidiphila]|uniref:Uncharacterized protein n=1 Tax=Claviceps humidiphila TaxID=1294629 RepID=A0A9P7Q155_9HYPO|nr:hypothetical protein E4U13_004709 [Claviceps humidiphila]